MSINTILAEIEAGLTKARQESRQEGQSEGYKLARHELHAKISQLLTNGLSHDQMLHALRGLLRELSSGQVPVPVGMTHISELNLNMRVTNALLREGITTVEVLAAMTEMDLWDIKMFGQGSINSVKAVLAERGLKLKEA